MSTITKRVNHTCDVNPTAVSTKRMKSSGMISKELYLLPETVMIHGNHFNGNCCYVDLMVTMVTHSNGRRWKSGQIS